MHFNVDRLDSLILAHLEREARIGFSELGRRIGLSSPAVAERIRRLEASGVITGYHAHIDPASIGRGIQAIVKITIPGTECPNIGKYAEDLRAVVECHRLTGEHSALLKVLVGSIAELESLVDRLVRIGKPSSSIVLSSPIRFRPLTDNPPP
ncbi:AsnC family transcriptional regulator [Steroidobacter agaridevorans]|uniref:AsnC family transcriptional regulator n=1 Tax=Steroidobacter agaridevorans TaxID=2695856 RepID=A0A829YJN6_9GAMM|nr:Lrp/AsnC family transcriptional regulator [Steroidobacter agaridevorans]GFE83594.1 AsnC family transcriptional regulator [Steroidobacter agaridevorans]